MAKILTAVIDAATGTVTVTITGSHSKDKQACAVAFQGLGAEHIPIPTSVG